MTRAVGAGSARKRHALGQHFLADAQVARDMLAFAGLALGERLLEIGPGRGALTEVLIAAGHPVVAVELDAELAEMLRTRQLPGLTVVTGDFLRIDDAQLP